MFSEIKRTKGVNASILLHEYETYISKLFAKCMIPNMCLQMDYDYIVFYIINVCYFDFFIRSLPLVPWYVLMTVSETWQRGWRRPKYIRD